MDNRIKISVWLSELHSHDIVNSSEAAADFEARTGHVAPWHSHSIKEAKAAIRRHPAGGQLDESRPAVAVAYAYEMAEACAKKLAGFESWQNGRGFRFNSAIAALRDAGH